MTTEELRLLRLLVRRQDRLQEEYKLQAPAIIIKNELLLIIDACNKLLALM